MILLLPDGRWHVCAMQALIIQLCDAPFGLPYSTIMIYFIYILIIFCIYFAYISPLDCLRSHLKNWVLSLASAGVSACVLLQISCGVGTARSLLQI